MEESGLSTHSSLFFETRMKGNRSTGDRHKRKKGHTSGSINSFTPLSFFGNYKFATPSKRIKNASDITTFVSSESYTTLLSFIKPLARAVQGQTSNADDLKRRASPAIT